MEYIEKLPFLIFTCGVVLLILLPLFATYYDLKTRWIPHKKQKKLNKLLAGRPLAQILSEAPYEFGHFQGEDGYRIWDKRMKNKFLHFAPTELDAHLWIVETYLSTQDTTNTPSNNQ